MSAASLLGWKHVVSVIVMLAAISLLSSSSVRAPPTSTVQRRARQQESFDSPKIVWLMSFPNSGTSFTLRMVKRTSLTLGASNYQEEGGNHVIPVHEGHPEGPFWPDPVYSKYKRPQKYVLTKTHCGFRCNDCSPSSYMKDAIDFPQLCATGKAVKGEEEWKVEYNTDRVHKCNSSYSQPIRQHRFSISFTFKTEMEENTQRYSPISQSPEKDFENSASILTTNMKLVRRNGGLEIKSVCFAMFHAETTFYDMWYGITLHFLLPTSL